MGTSRNIFRAAMFVHPDIRERINRIARPALAGFGTSEILRKNLSIAYSPSRLPASPITRPIGANAHRAQSASCGLRSGHRGYFRPDIRPCPPRILFAGEQCAAAELVAQHLQRLHRILIGRAERLLGGSSRHLQLLIIVAVERVEAISIVRNHAQQPDRLGFRNLLRSQDIGEQTDGLFQLLVKGEPPEIFTSGGSHTNSNYCLPPVKQGLCSTMVAPYRSHNTPAICSHHSGLHRRGSACPDCCNGGGNALSAIFRPSGNGTSIKSPPVHLHSGFCFSRRFVRLRINCRRKGQSIPGPQ